MKRLTILASVLLFTTATLAGHAGPMGGAMRGPMGGPRMGGGMGRDLFPPEIILMNQIALGLSADQVTAIKKEVGATHGRALDVQVDLHRVTEQLHGALESPKVDEAAALALASQAMDLEKQVKTAHLTLMIRVKNLLTPEQQDRARALKPERPMGPPDADPD
jgi:Spy/CpxP family protein refolding chaperone